MADSAVGDIANIKTAFFFTYKGYSGLIFEQFLYDLNLKKR